MHTRQSPPDSTAGSEDHDDPPSLAARSVWTEAEEIRMIDYLVQHKAEAGDGVNFKKTVWNGVAKELAPRWNWEKCKSKWARVRSFPLLWLGLFRSVIHAGVSSRKHTMSSQSSRIYLVLHIPMLVV